MIPPRQAFRLWWMPWAILVAEFVAAGTIVGSAPGNGLFMQSLAATALLAGRQWPLWRGRRGEAGLVTAMGALTAITPLALAVGPVLWGVGFVVTGYRPVGALVAAAGLPFVIGLLAGWPFAIMSVPVCLMCVERLAPAVGRVRAGDEPKHHWRSDA